ncbi:MAG: hypothetical protein LBU64_11835 [Planctomycetota bacterium]|nr:hypothetical protein [Planctomycetota bacterium]
MDRAQERHTGKLLTAREACATYGDFGRREYVCLCCGNEVILVRSRLRNPHFKHRKGNNGFEDCENYLGLGFGTPTDRPADSDRIPLDKSWPDWTDSGRRSDGGTEAEEFRQAAFVVEELELMAYWEDDPQGPLDLVAVSTAQPSDSAEGRLAGRLRSTGYLVGVFDGFCDAYLITTIVETGDCVALLGPKGVVDRQAEELGALFRQLGMEHGLEVVNHPELSGLPDGWALLRTTLPDGLLVGDLPWILSSPYSLRGGWAWRHRVYFPDAPPEIIRSAAAVDGRWQVRRLDREGREDWPVIEDSQADTLPAATFDRPARYQVRVEGMKACSLVLEEPRWSFGEWSEQSTTEGGWYWQPDSWPASTNSNLNSASRLFGALVENRFPESSAHSIPENPDGYPERIWLRLAADAAIRPLETPIAANSHAFGEHELYRHLRNIRGGRR